MPDASLVFRRILHYIVGKEGFGRQDPSLSSAMFLMLSRKTIAKITEQVRVKAPP